MRRYIGVMQNASSDASFNTIQNVRQDIIGELDAIIEYSSHLRQATELSAQLTFKDIISEEQVHVGELMALLFKLDPDSKANFDKGVAEFNNRQAINS